MKQSTIDFNQVNHQTTAKLSNRIALALEAQDNYQKSVDDMQNNQEALDIAQSLEDLHIVLKDMDTKSPTEVSLIKSIANTAVAGKVIDSDNVIPAIENIGEKQAVLTSLLERVGTILNSYIHSVSQSLELLVKYLNSILRLIKQNITTIENLKTKFPVPDDKQDDMQRSVKFDSKDQEFMVTPVGVANTFGDVFSSFKVTRKSFKELTDTSTPISSKIAQMIRQIIPSQNVDTYDKLACQIDSSNKILFDGVTELWGTNITKSSLFPERYEDECDSFQTGVLLGSTKIGFKVKNNDAPQGTEIDELKKSETVRSFNILRLQKTQETAPEESEFVLTGITNTNINLFIEEIKMFIVDLERYVIWCLTTAQMSISQLTNDVANIDQYYSGGSESQLSSEQSEKTRQAFQSHITDVRSMVNAMVDISTAPTQYASNLLTGLIVVISKMPQEMPVGSYNGLK